MVGPSQGTLAGLRWWPFVVLVGASFLLLLSNDPSMFSTAGLPVAVRVVILVSGLAFAVFLEVMARMLQARPRLATGYDASPEAARAILDASAGLTRVLNLAVAIFTALLAVPYTWLPGLGSCGALALGFAIIVGAIAWAVWSLKSVHGDLAQAGRLGGLEGWNGIIYSNPRDPRLWVPKISGYGTTLNFAHRRAWLLLGSILMLSLGTAALGMVSAFCR
jgi:uncharacterized membrane protein